jgi:tetratricopeptide (TPR) repeat protein
MIVRNEAANLPACLTSVKDVVDELIVLDTGSTDETVTIAQSFGAQVPHFAWCNDFSAARNASLKYATGDWILVLDADERLVPEIVPAMQQAMRQPNALVINLLRAEVGAVQSPYSLVSRLFRNHPDVQFSRPYHALVDDSVMQLLQQEPQWQVLSLPQIAIRHYGYEPSTIAARQKLDQARTAMEEYWLAHPDDPYVCSKLGALYIQIGDFTQGVDILRRGLRSIAQSPTPVVNPQSSFAPILYELHYHLAIAYNRLQQPPTAEQHYRSAIQVPILDRLKLGAYNNLGSLLQAKGDLAGAKAAYEACLNIDPNFAVGYYNMGMVLKASGQLMESATQYQKAIALNPNYAEAHQNLGVVLLKLGNILEGKQAFLRAIELHERQNSPEAARLRQGLQQIGFRV